LNVVSLEMPALRERRDDIMLLANYFADKYGARCNRKLKGFSPEARNYLTAYDWPGNVRELENTIERAIVLGTTEWILPEDLPESMLETKMSGGPVTTYHEAVVQNKKQIILQALEGAQQNHAEAARLLGIHPNYLQRLIRILNVKIN